MERFRKIGFKMPEILKKNKTAPSIAINRIALYILLFFGVFDTARLFTPLPSYVGYLKEICIFFLFFQLLIKKIEFKSKSFYGKAFLLLFFISGLCLLRAIFFSNYHSSELIIFQVKGLEFFLIFLIFINLHKIVPTTSLDKVIKIYIVLSIVLVAVNFIGVLIPNPICYKYVGRGDNSMMFTGRMSLGQPAMATFPILLTFILFWMKKERNTFNNAIIFISLISIILSTAMTAYAIVGCVIFIKFCADMKSIKEIKNNIFFIFAMLIIAIIGYRVVISYLSQDASILNFDFLKDRFFKMMGYGDYEDVARLMRTQFREIILQKIYSENAFIFGLGPDYYHQIRTDFYAQIPIENTYIDFYAKSGLLGLASFGLLIIASLKYFSKNNHFNFHNSQFLLVVGILTAMLLYSWTLPIFATYCMAFGFALFFAYFYRENKEKNV